MTWIRPLIEQFNSEFPLENELRWWKSDRYVGSNTERYGLATPSYDFIVFVDEKESYAPLVSAYYVEHERRRDKFRREHDIYWAQKQEPPA